MSRALNDRHVDINIDVQRQTVQFRQMKSIVSLKPDEVEVPFIAIKEVFRNLLGIEMQQAMAIQPSVANGERKDAAENGQAAVRLA